MLHQIRSIFPTEIITQGTGMEYEEEMNYSRTLGRIAESDCEGGSVLQVPMRFVAGSP